MAVHTSELVQGMHVVRDGVEGGAPVVLVHGSGASGATWAPIVPALAGRHDVVRVDLPGCGQSPPAPDYEVPAQADRVAAVLDGLGLRGATVVGHSSGGYIATALAERRPELVGSLALISSGPEPGALRPQPLLLRLLLAPPLGPLVWKRRSDDMIRRGLLLTCARPVEIPDDLVAGVRTTGYRTTRAILRANTTYIAERSIPARLADRGVPLLVVFGGADPRWDPASAEQYRAVPGARIELLPEVGHLPMLEAPEATAELVLDFTGAHARP
ncbi:MAG TPA: alpha/beta hydrolase [Acidimicrobiales bacterium]